MTTKATIERITLKGTYQLVPVKRIKAAPFNPADRTEQKKLRKLVAAIKALEEVLVPLIVNSATYELIDGHRRLAAARVLGMTHVPAIVRPMTEEEARRAYAAINSTGLRTSANESLQVWLQEPTAVDRKYSELFSDMVEAIGSQLVRRMARQGNSPRLFTTAKRLARYCSIDSRQFLGKALVWLMEHSSARQVEIAMAVGQPASVLARAVNSGKPLTVRMTLGE